MSEFEIFEAARKLTDPGARAAFVELASAGNVELQANVLALLAASGLTCEFLDAPAASLPSEPPAAPEPVDPPFASTLVPTSASPQPSSDARVIAGKYKLIQQIGEGGMGTVFMAEQLAPIRRKVAVKLIKEGRDSKAILARFSAEQQAIALMDHPNIARLFDAGTTDHNEPYFVMELINGKPIAAYCDENRLTMDERIALFIPVCHAIQHAHHKGIIHRDIKSTNIIVAQYDGVPVAKVIDFGLVKAIGQQLTDHTSPSLYGAVVGTPGYMSPEQATSNQLDIDSRSDIYSLAAVLYELLTGSTPHSMAELKERAILEVLRIIREDEPAKASHRLSSSNTLPSLAATRRTDPRRLVGFLKGELDLVVMKALDRERNRRYQHPSDFADDLQRFLDHEPVRAAAPTLTYQLKKFLRKRWKVAVVVASLLLTATAGLIGIGWQEYRRLEEARGKELSDLKAEKAEQNRKLAVAQERETKRESQLIQERAESRVREADSSEYVGLTGKVFREEFVRSPGWAERSWEYLKSVTALQTPLRSDSEIRSAAAAVLVADEYRSKLDWIYPVRVKAAAYSPSGDILAIAPYSDYLHPDPQIILLDASTGKPRQEPLSGPDNWAPSKGGLLKASTFGLKSSFNRCIFPDSTQVLWAATRWGRLYRFDLSKSPPNAKFANVGNETVQFDFTPDLKWCITLCINSNKIQCWDTQTLELVGGSKELDIPGNGAILVQDSESLLVTTRSGPQVLSIPDLKAKQTSDTQLRKGIVHPSGEFYLGFDGQAFHATSWHDGRQLHTYQNPESVAPIRLESAASSEFGTHSGFSPSGQFFAASCGTERGAEVRVWDAWGGKPRWIMSSPPGSRAVQKWDGHAVAGDARRTALLTDGYVVQYSRIRPALACYRAPGHPSGVHSVRTAPDGCEVCVLGERRADGDDSFVVWKTSNTPHALHSRIPVKVNSIPQYAFDCLSYSPNGKCLATVGYNQPKGNGVIISDCTSHNTGHTIFVANEQFPPLRARALAGFGWTSKGGLVSAIDAELFAWNVQSTPPSLMARTITFNVTGGVRGYASMAMNGTDVGWAVTIQSELRKFRLGPDRIDITNHVQVPGEGNTRICRINPSNSQLAIGKADGTVVLYDTTKEVFGPLLTDGHADSVQAMVWLSDRRLVTGSRDGWFAIWDVSDAGHASLWYKLQLKAPVSDVAPTADKQAVYVACSDETSLRVLDLDVIDRELAELFSKSAPVVPSDSDAAHPETDVATRDQNIIGRVAMKADRKQASEPAINYTTEREAAEWVLSIGGSVTVAARDGREIPCEANQLPEQNFLVRDVLIDGSPKFANAGFEKLRGCRALMTLKLFNLPGLSDESVALLDGAEIRSLSIVRCPTLTDKVTGSIAKLSRLESLHLQAGRLTDGCIPSLAPLTRLSAVTIAEPDFTNSGLAKLAEVCPRIHFVDISSAPQSSLNGSPLVHFGELTEARLCGSQFTEEVVQSFNSLPDLKTLRIVHSVSDSNIRQLGKLNGVTTLYIQSNTPNDRTALSQSIYAQSDWSSSLTDLHFVGSKVAPRDEDLARLADLSQLRAVRLDCRQDSNQSPRYTNIGLTRFRRLRRDIRFTDEDGPQSSSDINYATERAVAEWVLSIGGTIALKDPKGNPLPQIETGLPAGSFTLDGVGFRESAKFDNEGLSKLVACHRLSGLNMVGLTTLTDAGMENLRGVSVRDLVIDSCSSITDKSIASIARFEGLMTMSLKGMAITDAGISSFRHCKTLEAINIATTHVTDAGLATLGENCPEINYVHIETSPLGQQSVRGLERYSKLNQIIINGEQLTDEAVVSLNRAAIVKSLIVRAPLREDSIKRLGRLKFVQTLHLSSHEDESATKLSATIYSDATWPAALENIYFDGSGASPRDRDLLQLAKLPGLKTLAVGCQKDLRHLQRYTHNGFVKFRELRPDVILGIEGTNYEVGQPLPSDDPLRKPSEPQ